MMLVSAHKGRATIETIGNRVRIRIPTAKNIFLMLFLCLWMVGWFGGEVSAIFQVLSGRESGIDRLILVWLCGWTIGGCLAIFTLLWNLAGAEYIIAGQGFLEIKKGILGFGINHEYTLSSASNFRVVPEDNTSSFMSGKRGMSLWGYINGPIAFDYGLKTVKFGLGIDEAEARHIIGVLREKGLIEEGTGRQVQGQ